MRRDSLISRRIIDDGPVRGGMVMSANVLGASTPS